MALGQVMKGKIMKTIMAAAIASLMLSGAAFAAAPMMGNGPKPSVQATGQGDVLLTAGSEGTRSHTGTSSSGKPSGQGPVGTPSKGACAGC